MNMLKLLPLLICILCSTLCIAQKERFAATYKKNNLVIEHKVKKGETVFSIARMFHAPPATVADINGLNYESSLREGQIVDVPLAVYNHINEEPSYKKDIRSLYYTVDGESMSRLVRITGVPQRKIEKWNELPDNHVRNGQELLIGWVLYDATPVLPEQVKSNTSVANRGDWSTRAVQENTIVENNTPHRTLDAVEHNVVKQEPVKVSMPSSIDSTKEMSLDEQAYMSQTMNGQSVIEEKGPAVFFAAADKAPKSYYAFHNSARRGSIIKVFNPGTGKTVFVKVIGAIPATAQYHNSVIGITAAAKKELGIRENKMFCELSYGVY